jgi:hypothetical protein
MILLGKNWNGLLEPVNADTKHSYALRLPLEGADHLRIRTPYCFQQMLNFIRPGVINGNVQGPDPLGKAPRCKA